MPSSIRAELYFGAAHGIALSAVVWSVAFGGLAFDAATALILAAGAAAGAARARFRIPAGIDVAYPWVLAAMWLHGPALSLLAALAAAIQPGKNTESASAAPRISGPVLSAAVAAGVFLLVPGRLPESVALLAHGAAYAIVLLLYDRGARSLTGRNGRAHHARSAPRVIVGAALTFLAALGLVAVLASPDNETALAAGLLLLSVLALIASERRERRERRETARMERRFARSTIEALTTLVASRDERTRDHVARVRQLALAVGRRLDLTRGQLRALEGAALLHDLGKLAVPEHILSKPGRLDREETERMRTHPVLGADVIDRIPASHDVAEIVRHHHERWDGTGYPAGLRGEGIPLTVRILTAVDNYDALTADRPYRAALSHEETLEFLRHETGRIFDALVVEALVECLEEQPGWSIEGSIQPNVGEDIDADGAGTRGALALAQFELQTLYEIARAQGYGMDLEEFLSLAACKLEPLIPHRSLVVYRIDEQDGLLRACFASGRSADRLRLTTIPLGERLSGWTAVQRRAHHGCDHRSPLHRDGFRSDLEDWADDEDVRDLGSAVSAPLIAGDRCVGVLTLYDGEERRFLGSERAMLVRIASRLAGAFEHRSPPTPVDASLTDPSTGVPNARFLWLETAYRIGQRNAAPTGFGLLAFRLLGIERVTEQFGHDTTDDLVGRVARRFATAGVDGETLVRFGSDLFVVLSAADEAGELTRRWHAIAMEVEQPIQLLHNRPVHQVRLSAAHAVFPEDGECLNSLLAALDERLALSTGASRTVVPFRAARERSQRPA